MNTAGLIRYRCNKGDCLHAHWSLPWCLCNAPREIYNFLIGCPLPKRKCLGVLAQSRTNHTGLVLSSYTALNHTPKGISKHSLFVRVMLNSFSKVYEKRKVI